MQINKIRLSFKAKKPVLALGSNTKNTVCFIKGDFAYLSQVHADLNNPKDFSNFDKSTRYFLKKRPQIIAHDLHPEYQSTKYTLSLPTTYYLLPTQHHHAHIASCMLDNGLRNQKVIGCAFDGTGLGTNNALWGAEFLICDYKNFQRRAHLREISLLGQERAILEPWRLAVLWLYLLYKDRFLAFDIPFVKNMDKNKWRVLKKMYRTGVNAPLASSMGRLFDAVASLTLAKYKADSEAELAIELEKKARDYRAQSTEYRFEINKEGSVYIINPLKIFKQIVSDIKAKEPKEKIAYCFHLTVAEMIKKMCLILRKEARINKVVLSGGVFQNSLLLSLALDLLYREGFQVFTHKRLSCSDSGISLGQVAIANLRS